jgi:hypothetical protein
MMRIATRVAWLTLLSAALVRPAPAATIQDIAGIYDGTWHNDTFSSEGAAHLRFEVADPAITIHIDMDGNVLGGADPGDVVLTGTISGGNASFDQTVATYGHVVASIQGSDGAFTGNLDMISASILSATGTGTVAGGQLNLAYSVVILGFGTATGTIAATRTPEPDAAGCACAALAALRAVQRRRREETS